LAKEPSESNESSLVPLAVAFEFGLGGVAALLGWLFGVNPFAALRWREPSSLLRSLACGLLAVIPPLILVAWAYRSRLGPLQRLRRLLDEQLMPHFADVTPPELAWLSLAAGVGEELLFRGFLQSALDARLNPDALGGWLPLILASVVFGMAHFLSATYLLLATGMGLYLGWLLIATESLWPPVVVHAVYDFVALRWLQRDFRKKRRAA
jgi:membrane protease YdiL (CAAX protease family)